MEIHARTVKSTFFVICILLLASWGTLATLEEDEKDCAEELGNLAACIPFVSGTAKRPTKECCDDTNKLRAAKPKCLCVLIKESTDPSMGLPINTTLALQMPAACNIDAKVSDCPTLLNLPADSPDAKIFKVASSADSSSTTKSPSDSTKSSSSSSSSTPATTTTTTSDTKTAGTTTNGAAPKMANFTILLMIGLALVSSILI